MSDITKCTNSQCKRRSECFRYLVEPNLLGQSYASFEHNDCGYFIPAKSYPHFKMLDVEEVDKHVNS